MQPIELYLRQEQCFQQLNKFPKYQLQQTSFAQPKAGKTNLPLTILPDIKIHHKEKNPLANIADFIENFI